MNKSAENAHTVKSWHEFTMQWLIDIILEKVAAVGYALQSWVQDQGYLTTSFVDRGDPPVRDFNAGHFIKDYTWHDLDLSSIVPEGAKGVLFWVSITNATINRNAQFRKAGNINIYNISRIMIQVAGVTNSQDLSCPISTARHLEYRISSSGWYAIDLTVKGWWL